MIFDKLNKNYFTRPFHTSNYLFIYPEINPEYDPINSDDIGEGSKSDKSRVINNKRVENKQHPLQVREDLRNNIKIIDKRSEIRSSDGKNKSEPFESFAYNEEKTATKVHGHAYSATNNAQYEDGINESAMTKAMFSIKKIRIFCSSNGHQS